MAESHKPLTNPTTAQLNTVAQMFLSNMQKEPKLFTGTLPMWTPPKGIEFTKDPFDETIWVMNKEGLDLSML